ncbi:hypothetical protein EHM92_00110 [bacterium]|nr:MAG: hypothetical protein EHM92_00110 [bacterium]
MRHKVVSIEWADSCQDISGSQMPLGEAKAFEPIVMFSCGYYLGLNDSKTAHVLASNVSEEGFYRSISLIPCVNVIRKKVLG